MIQTIENTQKFSKNGDEENRKTRGSRDATSAKSHESTRQRAESLQSTNHEDHIAGRRFTSMTHYNLVHKPLSGACFCAWFSARCPARLVCVTLVTAVSVFWSLSHWLHACSALLLRLLMGAYHLGAPGAESQRFSARCTCSFHRFWLAAHFCSLSPLAVCALGFLMSRGDELRQLAAQLSVLAAVEDSIAVGLSRVMGPASPGRGAVPPDTGSPLAPAVPAAAAVPAAVPSPSHEVAASLLRSASLRAASLRTRTRSRSPAPLPKRAPRAPRRSSSVASGLRGSVALAESGLVTGLATKSCPPVPPPQLRLSRVSRALHAASAGSQPSADVSGPSAPSAPGSEAPRATESASNSDDGWDALHDAHGLAPSLGGTAAAVAQPTDAAGASRRARDKRRRR